jgi:DNA-binding NarL/FixJ family response regulator
VPSFAGLDTLAKIGRVASRVPVLLLSAGDSKAQRMWAVEVGVLGYVTKPVDGQLLARFISKVLKGY